MAEKNGSTPLRVAKRSGSFRGFDIMAGGMRIASLPADPGAQERGEELVRRHNAHDALVEMLDEALVELKLLNLREDGGQKTNTPAANKIARITTLLDEVRS